VKWSWTWELTRGTQFTSTHKGISFSCPGSGIYLARSSCGKLSDTRSLSLTSRLFLRLMWTGWVVSMQQGNVLTNAVEWGRKYDCNLWWFCLDGSHFMTATCAPRMQIENGFKVWDFTGKLVYEWVARKHLFEIIQFPVHGDLPPFPDTKLDAHVKAIQKVNLSKLIQTECVKTLFSLNMFGPRLNVVCLFFAINRARNRGLCSFL